MATASRKTSLQATTREAPARSSPTSAGPDAIALLRADHKRVSDLYEQYEKARSTAKKRELVATICQELSIHAQVEEEIFYPAVKAALKDKEPDGEMFDAKIKVMSEYTKHHVKEEQNEMFPKAKATRLDMKQLGAQIAARKEELMANPDLLEKPPVPAAPEAVV